MESYQYAMSNNTGQYMQDYLNQFNHFLILQGLDPLAHEGFREPSGVAWEIYWMGDRQVGRRLN